MVNEIKEIFRKHFERFIAFFIDWFIILLPNVLVSILLESFYKNNNHIDFLEIRLGLTYFIYFTFFSLKRGQTIGKRLIKLKIVNLRENTSINLTTSIYRHMPLTLLFIFSFFIPSSTDTESQLNLFDIYKNIPGFWLISEIVFYLIKNNGQMLHDYIAKTTVIKLT